jgi:hypothetical protein
VLRASRGGWDDAVIQGIEPPTSDCKVALLTGVLLQHCMPKSLVQTTRTTARMSGAQCMNECGMGVLKGWMW